MIYEVRVEAQDKSEKMRKELITTNKALESKIDELEHRIFTLEIENQALAELPKKDEEIRRLTGKIY